jgi:hypothetical protein
MQKLSPAAAAFAALAVGALALGGCASEKYVNEHVSVVDAKAQATQGQVSDQQAALQAHDTRLGELDKTARDALDRARPPARPPRASSSTPRSCPTIR